MIEIVPNIGMTYVTRRGNQFFNRLGVPILTIEPSDHDHFRHIQEGVELVLKYYPMESRERLEDELREAQQKVSRAEEERDAVIRRIDRMDKGQSPTPTDDRPR